MNENLYLIIPYFNFFKNEHRIINLKKFLFSNRGIKNLKIILVEGISEDSQYFNPIDFNLKTLVDQHIIYKIPQPIFVKENLINLVVKNHLPNNWQFFSWMDCDVIYENDEWVKNTLNELKSNDLVQMFSLCLNENSESNYELNYGLIYGHRKIKNKFLKIKNHSHSGFAWAINRNFYEKIGKLWDLNIIGGGDTVLSSPFNPYKKLVTLQLFTYSSSFAQDLQNFWSKFETCKYGFIKNYLIHLYHADLIHRNYESRHFLLKSHKYSQSSIDYNKDGIIFLNNEKILDDIINYMRIKESTSIL
jgi:hypothetical protein